jgi:hypothetical protein
MASSRTLRALLPAASDPEIVHLIIRPLGMPGEDVDSEVVRVRLADVIAWTVAENRSYGAG